MALNYTPVVQVLQHAKWKMKYPFIVLRTEEGHRIKLKMAEKGYIGITLDGDYVGKIGQNGLMALYSDKELVSTILSELNEDPLAYTKAQGLKYGFCCFCGRELTDPKSVVVGYGPICADTFGLPWGEGQTEEDIIAEGINEAFQPLVPSIIDPMGGAFIPPVFPSIRKPLDPKAVEEEMQKLAPLGEAERMLNDIDNGILDNRIEGIKDAIGLIDWLQKYGLLSYDNILMHLNCAIDNLNHLRK